MLQIHGPGLEPARQSLGLEGAGAQITEFPDGIAEQVIDMVPIIRRGRTLAASEGIFGAHLGNTHAGAGALTATVNPYDLTSAIAAGYVVGAGYPNPVVPVGLDVWVLAVSAFTPNAGTTTSAKVQMVTPSSAMGWGTVLTTHPVPLFTSVQATLAEVATPQVMYRDLSGAITMFPRIRVPRGATLTFQSVATGVASHFAQMILGVFPAGLGQDGCGQ